MIAPLRGLDRCIHSLPACIAMIFFSGAILKKRHYLNCSGAFL
jgi:hypothetical protein